MAVVTTGIKYNKLISKSDTADKLTSAVDISIQDADGTNTGTAVSFDGSDDTTAKLPSTIKATLTGNASSATEFFAAQSVTLTGDITGTTSSKAGWSVATTLKNSGVTANTYRSVTVDSKGIVTAGTNPTTLNEYGITDAKIENGVITLGENAITPLTAHQILPTLSKTDSGSGNAVTDISVSNHAITVTKGSTFLTEHQSLSSCVKTTGNETISGQKTFAEGPYGTTTAMSAAVIDLSTGNVFTKTISANTTFTITNAPNGKSATFSLILTNGGAYTITWPASVKWADGTAPDLTESGVDVLTFLTPNGGATWYGTVSLSNAS